MSAREEWRVVPGYPDYSVSSEGRVISRRRGAPRLLGGWLNCGRYPSVVLCNDEGQAPVCIHRIVLLAFVGPCPEGMEVRHLDDVGTNNSLSNLAYGTHGDNMRDMVANGAHASLARTHCPSGHPYDEENTYVLPSRPRARYCRACRQAYARNRTRSRAA